MPKKVPRNLLPSIALIEPQFSINVGYVARVMANFGFSNLYIVSKDKMQIDWEEASKFASHGGNVIRGAIFVPSISSLRRTHSILVGTTAIRARRKSNISRSTMDFESFMPTLALTMAHHSTGKRLSFARTCFVFGRDTTGLTNEEIRVCDYAVTINTGTKYMTLNISHAVSIVLYEISKYLRVILKTMVGGAAQSNDYARQHELVVKMFLDLAAVSDFQSYKRQKLAESLSRLINRGNPSLRETYLLLGLASKAKSRIINLQGKQSA